MRPLNDEPLNAQDRVDVVVATLLLGFGAFLGVRADVGGWALFGFVAFFAVLVFVAGWLGTPEDRLIDKKTVRLRRAKRILRLCTYGAAAGFAYMGNLTEKCTGSWAGP